MWNLHRRAQPRHDVQGGRAARSNRGATLDIGAHPATDRLDVSLRPSLLRVWMKALPQEVPFYDFVKYVYANFVQ